MSPKPPKAKPAKPAPKNPLPPTPTQNPPIKAGESAKEKFPALDPSNPKARERLTHLDRVAKARKADAADREVGKVQGQVVDKKGRPVKGTTNKPAVKGKKKPPPAAEKPYVPSEDDKEEAAASFGQQNSSQMHLGDGELLELKGAGSLDPAKLKKAGKWEKAKGIAKGIGGAAAAAGGAALAVGGAAGRVLGTGADVAGRAISAAGLKRTGKFISGGGKAVDSLGKSAMSGGSKTAKFGAKHAVGGAKQAKQGGKMQGTADKLQARAERLKAAGAEETSGAEGAENSTPETTPAPSGKGKRNGKPSSLKLVK